MKPDYTAMSKEELKTYVLQNREDIEAIRALFETPPDVEIKRYPPVVTEDGTPIEENIQIMERAIEDRIAQDNHNDDSDNLT